MNTNGDTSPGSGGRGISARRIRADSRLIYAFTRKCKGQSASTSPHDQRTLFFSSSRKERHSRSERGSRYSICTLQQLFERQVSRSRLLEYRLSIDTTIRVLPLRRMKRSAVWEMARPRALRFSANWRLITSARSRERSERQRAAFDTGRLEPPGGSGSVGWAAERKRCGFAGRKPEPETSRVNGRLSDCARRG